MPFVTPTTLSDSYDAIIVGSGAAGGQTAYVLTMEGAKVLMVEAGRQYDPLTETPMLQTNDQAPLRGAHTPDKQLFFYDATVAGGWTVPGEPYTNAGRGADRFMWWRPRMLGGRTNHWGRQTQRQGPYDFKPRSRDDVSVDWPISYEEIAPYYDKVEMLIGVWGANEGWENVPDSSPGVLLPPPKPRIGELLIAQRVPRLGMRSCPIHNAILSQRLDAESVSRRLHPNNPKAQRILRQHMESRAACFWATACPRGCSIKANYQSTTVHLPPALATGNLDILSDAMVREVEVRDGKARGVVFIDKRTGTEHRARARAVVLGAGSMESVRLLLNSKSAQAPDGLANSSGLVGRFIVDSTSTSLPGQIPLLESLPAYNEDGAGGAHHIHIPWWGYREQKAGKLDFPGGYEILFTTGRQMPTLGTMGGLDQLTGGSFGLQLKADARRYYGSFVTFKGEGRMIPNDRSYCEIDPQVKDKWGIPALRFHWKHSEHEFRQAAHMQRTFADMFEVLGGKPLHAPDLSGRHSLLPGGHLKHEAGGARMGTDPRNSVTNSWGQTWDVKNLLIADGAVFCGNSDKGPTETILALAWRVGDRLLEMFRKQEA